MPIARAPPRFTRGQMRMPTSATSPPLTLEEAGGAGIGDDGGRPATAAHRPEGNGLERKTEQ